MKSVKLSLLALATGLFIASCGNGKSESSTTDSTTMSSSTAPATPVNDGTTAPADSMNTAAPVETSTTTTTSSGDNTGNGTMQETNPAGMETNKTQTTKTKTVIKTETK